MCITLYAVRAPPSLDDMQDNISQATSAVSFHSAGHGTRDVQHSDNNYASPLVHSHHHRHHGNHSDVSPNRKGLKPAVKLPPLQLPGEKDSVSHGSTDHTSGTSQGGSTARTKYSDVMSPRTRQILYGDQHSRQPGSTQSSPWPFTAIEALYTTGSYTSLGGSSLASPSHRRVRKRKSRQEELEETKWMRKLQLAKNHHAGTNC